MDKHPPLHFTHSRRWWALGVVVAAQFVFGVNTFIVNAAIPVIVIALHANAAQMEAVIASYLVAYATLVVIGGRLGDIYGSRTVFIVGVLGFSLASIWCGLSQSGPELIAARIAQGAAAAMMVPQVLATIHALFTDELRARAFGIYGIVLGLSGAVGFVAGGFLASLNIGGDGWRAVFLINVPIGLAIAAAAWRAMPPCQPNADVKLDIGGAMVLFAALLCLIGPLLFGREAGWALWVWLVVASGVMLALGFLRLEGSISKKGGTPLVDFSLLTDPSFALGLVAVFVYFLGNLSFFLVTTLLLQNHMHAPPLATGVAFVPLTITFVIASRIGAARALQHGARILIKGCAVQIAGFALLVTVSFGEMNELVLLASVLAVIGYGQGTVMAPMSGLVLSTVPSDQAGSGAGVYGMAVHIANAAGIATIGAIHASVQAASSPIVAFAVAIACCSLCVAACAALLCAWQKTQRN